MIGIFAYIMFIWHTYKTLNTANTKYGYTIGFLYA